MDPNKEPYPMTIKIKGTETNLKQIFTEDYYYWTKVFKGYSPIEPPGYSVFRKAIKGSNFHGLTLQILLLKCEGHKFPRNPNASILERHCETLFYGPLVVSTNNSNPPYMLSDFTFQTLNDLDELNNQTEKQLPNPADISNLSKFEPLYDNLSPLLEIDYNEETFKLQNVMEAFQNRNIKSRSSNLPYKTINLDEMMQNLDKETFFMYRFKTEIWPNIGIKHNYKDCLYFHNPKDYRRKPDFIRYYPENCQNGINCPNNPYCDMSHSLFETLYHPLKYKVNLWDKIVRDVNNVLYWIRGDRWAFYHDENDQRKIASNGCKLNSSPEFYQSFKNNASVNNFNTSGFLPFAPNEDIGADVSVYQRRHARSDYMLHPSPSLTQPVAIGASNHSLSSQSNYGDPNVIVSPPIGSSLHHTQEVEAKEMSDHSDSLQQNTLYANHLFEGSTIPTRQKSYSENTIEMMRNPYNRHQNFLQPVPQVTNSCSRGNARYISNASPALDSHGVGSTTPSSDINKSKNQNKPESDHLKYLFDPSYGYQRRADSFNSPAPPGLSSKYKMEEIHESRSQCDFQESYNDKLENKFIKTPQRKITEDKANEDSSENSAEHKNDMASQKSASK